MFALFEAILLICRTLNMNTSFNRKLNIESSYCESPNFSTRFKTRWLISTILFKKILTFNVNYQTSQT